MFNKYYSNFKVTGVSDIPVAAAENNPKQVPGYIEGWIPLPDKTEWVPYLIYNTVAY